LGSLGSLSQPGGKDIHTKNKAAEIPGSNRANKQRAGQGPARGTKEKIVAGRERQSVPISGVLIRYQEEQRVRKEHAARGTKQTSQPRRGRRGKRKTGLFGKLGSLFNEFVAKPIGKLAKAIGSLGKPARHLAR
jgi:hypothetical protein